MGPPNYTSTLQVLFFFYIQFEKNQSESCSSITRVYVKVPSSFLILFLNFIYLFPMFLLSFTLLLSSSPLGKPLFCQLYINKKQIIKTTNVIIECFIHASSGQPNIHKDLFLIRLATSHNQQNKHLFWQAPFFNHVYIQIWVIILLYKMC